MAGNQSWMNRRSTGILPIGVHLTLAPCGLQDSHILFVAHGQAENMKFEPQRRKGAEVAKPSVGENSFTGIGYE
jgi:hypothetical protein